MAYSEKFKTPEEIIANTEAKKKLAEQQKLVVENGMVIPKKEKEEEIKRKLELGPEQQ